MVDISLESNFSWPGIASCHQFNQQSIQVDLVSLYGQATSLPLSVLIAISPFLQSILAPSCSCSWSTTISTSISLPSASASTLKLLAQILCKGETDQSEGLKTTLTNLRELQEVMELLGMDIKINAKLNNRKVLHVPDLSETDVVGLDEEVMDDFCEMGEHSDASTNSNIGISEVNSSLDIVKFKQTGLLKDFKVDLVNCLDGINNNEKESRNIIDETCKVTLVRCFGGSNNNEKDSKKLIDNTCIIKCDICDVNLSNYQNLRWHNQEKHGFVDNIVLNDKKYRASKNRCPKCNLMFSSWGMLMKHFHQKHKYDSVGLGYQCKDCDMNCSNIGNLQRHRQARHRDLGGKSQDKSITECGLITTNQEILSLHCQEYHQMYNAETPNERKASSSISQYSIMKCEECQQTFFSKDGLRVHIERIHEGIDYGCGVCDFIAGYRSSIRKHCRKTGHNSSLIRKINP